MLRISWPVPQLSQCRTRFCLGNPFVNSTGSHLPFHRGALTLRLLNHLPRALGTNYLLPFIQNVIHHRLRVLGHAKNALLVSKTISRDPSPPSLVNHANQSPPITLQSPNLFHLLKSHSIGTKFFYSIL